MLRDWQRRPTFLIACFVEFAGYGFCCSRWINIARS